MDEQLGMSEEEAFDRQMAPDEWAAKDAVIAAKEESKKLGTLSFQEPETAYDVNDEEQFNAKLAERTSVELESQLPAQETDPYTQSYDATPTSEAVDPIKYEEQGLTDTIDGHKVISNGDKPLVKVGDEWLDATYLDVPGYYTPEQTKVLRKVQKADVDKQRIARKSQDIEGEYQLRPEGLEDTGLRTKMEMAETFTTKRDLFKAKYPKGDIAIDKDGTLKFYKTPEELWTPVDPKVAQAGWTDFGNDMGEMLGDDAGAIAGEIALVAGAGVLTGGGAWAVLGAGALGAYMGNWAQEAIEDKYYKWDQESTFLDRQKQSLTKAGFSVVGGGLFMGGKRVYDMATGAGFLNLTPKQQEVITAAKELGFDLPSVGSIKQSKLILKWEAQADSVTSKMTKQTEKAQLQIKTRLEKNVDTKDSNYLIDGSMMRDMNIYFKETMKRGKANEDSALQSGQKLFNHMDQWKTDSAKYVSVAYDKARAMEAPKLNIKGLKQAVAKADTDKMVPVTKLKRAAADLFEQKGKVVPYKATQSASTESATVNGYKKLIASLDEELVDMDHLITIRSELFDLKTVSDPLGKATPENRQAQKLYNHLSDVMNNPLNEGASGEAYKAAAALARQRFALREAEQVLKLSQKMKNSASPSKAIIDIISQADQGSMQQMKDLLAFHSTPESGNLWRNVQDAFRNDIANNLIEANGKLNGMRPEARRLLINESDETALRKVGTQIEELHSSNLAANIKSQATARDLVRKTLLDNKDQGSIMGMKDFLDKNPHAHKAMKGEFMNVLVEKITQYGVKDGKLINDKAAQSIMKDMIDSPVGKFFMKEGDRELISKIAPLVKYYNSSGDIQASLLGGEIAAGMGRFEIPAFLAWMKHNFIGGILTSPAYKKAMLGNGKASTPFFGTVSEVIPGFAVKVPHANQFTIQLLAQIATEVGAYNKLSQWDENAANTIERQKRAQAVGAY